MTLSHLDAAGRARMVDVGGKPETVREAVAEAIVRMRPETLALVCGGQMPKGDVLACARIAGIMAAKETSRLIPLCHPLPLSEVAIDIAPHDADALRVQARVGTVGRTGVEMEALTAVTVASLSIYDMCKAVDRGMRIESVCLLEKRGGRSGDWRAASGDVAPEAHVDAAQ